MDKPTHTVVITVLVDHPAGQCQQNSVSISGNGNFDHMIEAFKTSLIASGFSLGAVKAMDELDFVSVS